MIAKVFVISDSKQRIHKLQEELAAYDLKQEHADVLYIDSEQKTGIEQARNIKEFFQLKPFQAKGRAVVIEDISGLTPEAQNALLKVLEEPPEEAVILLGTSFTHHLLPTVLSRVQVVQSLDPIASLQDDKEDEVVEKILVANTEERFKIVEKATDKKELLRHLLKYSEKRLTRDPDFHTIAKDILRAEEWIQANVNARGAIEYLMLILPKKHSV